mgnify:FL=1
MKVLLSGGAGYIGSHTAIELRSAGHDVVIVDNFSNSKPEVLRRLEKITGAPFAFHCADVCDKAAMDKIFAGEKPEAIIHFAGYKAVGESVEKPLEYYRNNLDSTLTLLELMRKYGVHNIVFSSSATVYGAPDSVPINESAAVGRCTNPYGWTKYMIEIILKDACRADPALSAVLLRYFNPIGAHESGLIGEDPQGIPNNLMPYITQVASGRLEKLHIFGNDYDTPDGTGVRDYIHVVDLARGHVCAIKHAAENKGADVINLGTGKGYSVLEMVKTFSEVSGVNIPYEINARRVGDIAECYADPTKAKEKLGWVAEKNLRDMCRDSWRWQKNNPHGYDD